jgi:predicted XRE-type DNA-binding protein
MASSDTHTRQRTKLKNAEAAIAETAGIEDKDITIFVGKGTAKTNEPFVILFYQSFIRLIVDENLTLTDLKVMLKILDFVSVGNVVHLTHAEIAATMEIKRPQVSKAIKNLIMANLLIQSPKKSLFVNPTIMCKENLRSAKKSQAYKLAEIKTQLTGAEKGLSF